MLVTEHLIERGRRRIAFLGQPRSSPEVMQRYLGYTDALRAAGIDTDDALRADAVTTEQSGHDAVLGLLNRGVNFDGMFGASDLMAIGGTRTLDAYIGPTRDRVDRVLTEACWSGRHLETRVFPGADHSERAWAKRLSIPKTFLLGPDPP